MNHPGTRSRTRGNRHSTLNSQQFRILGVLGKLYALMENASGLVLVDQHAAQERILFEEMRKRMEDQGVPAQRRLIQDLLACELPYCCPQGRPTMIQIGCAELEKKFGRKV